MADNDTPNKHGRNDPNQMGSGANEFLEDLGRIERRSAFRSIEERERSSRYRTAKGFLDFVDENKPSLSEALEREAKRSRETVNSLGTRIRLSRETKRERAVEEARSLIERTFDPSSVNGVATRLLGTEAGQGMAVGMMGSSYSDLEARRQAIAGEMNQLGQQGLAATGGMFTSKGVVRPEARKEMEGLLERRAQLARELAGIQGAQRMQARLGLDPESQMESLLGAGQKAEGTIFRKQVADELRSGKGDLGGKSFNQLREREVQLSQQLVEELNKLKDSVGKSTEEINAMKDAAGKTAEDLRKTEEAVRQTGGGGGRFGNNIGNMLNLASAGFGALGAGVQAVAVNQRLAQVQNIAGYAGIENQKYQTYRSASAGDVMSQLMLGQFGASESFGREIRAGANVAVGAQVAGSGAQAVAGGLRAASTLNPGENIIATSSAMSNRIQGAQDLLQGTVGAGVGTADIVRDVSGSQAAIAGVNAQVEARRQLMMVGATQLQGFRDFSVGMGTAAMQMGSRGAGFVQRTISNENMAKMVNARISPEQLEQMAQIGVQNIGSVFNENQVFSARNLERAGQGTMQQNMQRMAVLAGAGSNNPQAGLSSVLEAAFSKSLEGSKVLNMVAENTGAVVERSAGRAMGFDTTAAAAIIGTAAVNTKDPNQEFAVRRAAGVAQRIGEIGTDTGVNFAAMAATARITQNLGVGSDEAIILQGLDDATLKTMRSGGMNQVRSALRDRGVDTMANKSDSELKTAMDKLVETRLTTSLTGGGTGIAMGTFAGSNQIAKDIMSGKLKADDLVSGTNLSPDQQRFRSAFARAAGLEGRGAEESLKAALGIVTSPNEAGKAKADDAMAGKGTSDLQKTLDDMRTQGFKQLSQAAAEATKNFGSAADALRALGELSKSVEKIGDTGGEGRFKTAAADAAGSFGKSVMTFDESVKVFQSTIQAMVTKSGISSGEANRLLDDLMKGVDSKRSTLGR